MGRDDVPMSPSELIDVGGTMDARLVSTLATLTMPAAALLAGAVPAHADGPVALSDVTQFTNPQAGSVQGAILTFTSGGANPPPGTEVSVVITSCGATIRSATHTFDGGQDKMAIGFRSDGAMTFFPDENTEKVGPSIAFAVTVTDPTYGVTSRTYEQDSSVPRPSCEELAESQGDLPIAVQRWSTKSGAKTAEVGRRLAITATRAAGARVAYTWRGGTTVVDRDRPRT